MNKEMKLLFITNLTMGIALIILFIFVNLNRELIEYPILFLDLLILLCFLLTLTIIKSLRNMKREEILIKSLEERNQNLKDNFDDIRSFRHDFCNIVQSMGGYIKNNDIEGLNRMYDSMIDEILDIKEIQKLNNKVIKNPALYNLLNNKFQIANNLDIKVEFNTLNNISNMNIDDFTLCRILGILIDNAIEETKENKNKFLSITFKYDTLNNRDLIIVKNTYTNKNVDLKEIYKNDYTTNSQNDNHGLGLWKVKRLVDKNKNLDIFTSKGKYFVQQLAIYR